MKSNFLLASVLCILICGHNVNSYSPLERRNFLEGEINQGMRTTPRPTVLRLPDVIPSPALPLWSVLEERRSQELEDLPKDKSLEEDELTSVDDLGLYDDFKNQKLPDEDEEFEDVSEDLKDKADIYDEENNTEKRYFSSLGGANIHGKRDGMDKRYFDSIGGSHVFKRALDTLGGMNIHGYKRALDSLGGWQIHGYKRQFDSLGGGNLLKDQKRFVSSLGGGNIHGFKRGLDTLGGMNLHDGYKRFVSSLGGGNIHSGFKRGLDSLGGANLHSGYKRYFSSLGGSNIHGYKRGLSSLGGANIHGYKRQNYQYGGSDLYGDAGIPEKRQLDSLGGFNVHRYKRSRVRKQEVKVEENKSEK